MTQDEVPESSKETEDAQPESWSILIGIVFGGIFLLLLEIGWTLNSGVHHHVFVSKPFYFASLVAMTFGLWLLHALPAWGLYELGRRYIARREVLLPAAAAIFGVSIQQTLLMGDGIGAHPKFLMIRVGFLIGFPLLFAFLTWLLITPRLEILFRYRMASGGLVLSVAFNLMVFIDYQQFHGHLAAFNAAVFVCMMMPLWRRPFMRRVTIAVAALVALTTAFVIPDQEQARTHVQRFSHIPASLGNGLPLGPFVQIQPDRLFEVQRAASPELQQYYETFFEQEGKFEATDPRGDNVLFIVVESVRADYWDDPELTPRFHEWKDQGIHIPRGIANYPATPLAYGAMFTAQPPSVVAQTPYWGQNRLFDRIKQDFDHLFFTRPDISWFEHTAITDFFVPRSGEINAHQTGPQGLTYLRENISQLEDGESFFSWVHLYEPHSPYEAREPWVDGADDDMSKYRSEIAYTDHHLGEFMEWFFEQPLAEDTLVILVADHGQGMGEEIFGEEFWGHHVHVHNVVSNVPMFFAGPDLPRGKRDEDLGVMQLDMMPTIYDFTGHALPEEMVPQGNSVYHLLEERPDRPMVTEAFSIRGGQFFDFVANAQEGGDVDELRREFHRISTDGQRYSPKIALQYGDHKIVYDRLLQRSWVYNIAEDPQERRNLVDEDPEIAEKMKRRLSIWNDLQGEVVRQLDELLVE